MTIQRKYSLPNCTLLLEGLSIANDGQSNEVRPVMSLLVNAECRFPFSRQPFTGGRDFFESLVTAVSGYAQEFLSKVHHLEAHPNEPELVQLQKVDNNRHRLIVQSEIIDLTTVQLFDLVEAVDQFFADSQTLPDLSLQLTPISKRHAGAGQTLVKQAVPAAVGVSSLALAAIAFFLVPIPEVNSPTAPKLQPNSGQSTDLPTRESSGPNPSPASPTPSRPN